MPPIATATRCEKSFPTWREEQGIGFLFIGEQKVQKWSIIAKSSSSALITDIENALLEVARSDVEIERFYELSDYLLLNPDMIPLLPRVAQLVQTEFRNSARSYLKLYKDPEFDDQHLTIYIRQHKYEEDIMDKLDNIFDQYADELQPGKGWLLVTTDFKII